MNTIANISERRGSKKAYVLAFLLLVAITSVSHLLPGKIKLDVLYVCCVLLVVGQPMKRIIIYSLSACCLILVTHLTLNRTLPLSWVAFVNTGISISAALITAYVGNKILKKNKVLEQSVAERTRDLSDVHNTLAESQSQLRAIFNTTDIAFLLLDSDLQVLTYNAIASQWSELSFGAPLQKGDYFWKALNEDRRESVRGMMQSVMNGDSINYEARYPLLEGASQWYQISMNPVKDQHNKIIGVCYSAINITSNKIAEMARMQIADDLEQRNSDLEQFAYVVSHHLRVPVANIIGLSDVLKQAHLPLTERAEAEEFLFQSIIELDGIVRELNRVLQRRRGDEFNALYLGIG
ncbi:MAG TPA: PAS domain-containing protein [Mucilaginibacter sp.]|nr:PAS domain-containing protein [Mucilaginibacter sp.]